VTVRDPDPTLPVGAWIASVAEAESAPPGLRAAVARRRPAQRPAARLRPRAAVAGAALAAGLAIILTVPANSTMPVADAAAIALRTPTHATQPGDDRSVYRRGSWGYVGRRSDRIGGRDAITTTYASGRTRMAYMIVYGRALTVPAAATWNTSGGTRFGILRSGGALVVTWKRGGYDCLLVSRTARLDRMLQFATGR
jgi:hypothetical protein